MLPEDVNQSIKQGENIRVEFKACRHQLSRDVYETICSFLNHFGGDIFLGVDDHGQVIGLEPDAEKSMQIEVISTTNNPAKINPSACIDVVPVKIDGKSILVIHVLESARIHRCNGRIFDRHGEADLDITNHDDAIAQLAIRKQKAFTENTVYPFLTLGELNRKLISRIRRMASLRIGKHPWAKLSDENLLQSTGMHLHDYNSGKSGLTLAAALLFGRDDVIRSILPFHRTDALLRRLNVDRYDDRDDVRTNLLDSYDRLMAFIGKHLNDPYYQEGTITISLRGKIFHEVIANMLTHREYTHPFAARLTIEANRVIAENGNKACGHGEIDPDHCRPVTKNPVIASIFREIGLADEIGSGVRNAFRYSRIYSGADPIFIEKDIFQTIIPVSATWRSDSLPTAWTLHDSRQPTACAGYIPAPGECLTADELMRHVLDYCFVPRTRKDIQKKTCLNSRRYLNDEILKPLVRQGRLRLDNPEKPASQNQKFLTWHPMNDP